MEKTSACRSAQSCATDVVQAVREFHAGVRQDEMALVLFFCSSSYDLAALAAEMAACFGDVPVVGCTTAGEIGPLGFRDGSLCGVSFAAQHFSAVVGLQSDLSHFDIEAGRQFAFARRQALQAQTEAQGRSGKGHKGFALLLVDGLSVKEEEVARAFQDGVGELPLVGGSAGDGLHFTRTLVYHRGHWHDDSAVLVVADTDLPLQVFQTQHFSCVGERLVVTAADEAQRLVREINGLPAAQEYARLAGVPVERLDPHVFAAAPVVVVIAGTDHVRSVQSVQPDGSLTFYCAIEEGLVFRVARGTDLLGNLEELLAQLHASLGPPQLVLGFDCILRKLEMLQRDTAQGVGERYRQERFLGFSTYGEQFWGVHVNQTLTGLAIGLPEGGDHA